MSDTHTQIDLLKNTLKSLRSPDGCPWDKVQTFQSLIPCIIEEAYELAEALETNDKALLKEELGDVLIHVIMLSNMAEEKQYFNLVDVAKNANDKMIRRHPHVFGDTKVNSVDDVWATWETIKSTEKDQHSHMDNIPKLPALMKAKKIQKKAAKAGFDWPDKTGPLNKLDEEVQEFKEALTKNNTDAITHEAGDILFTIVNCLRKLNIDPETALQQSNQRFMTRFKAMEQDETNITKLSLKQKEALWQKAKLATD